MAEAPKTARSAFLFLVALSIGLLAILISPFASALFLAAVLAGAFHPLQRRLADRLGEHRHLAAGLVTLAVLLALVLPLATIATLVVREAIDALRFVRATLQSEGVAGLVQALPGP